MRNDMRRWLPSAGAGASFVKRRLLPFAAAGAVPFAASGGAVCSGVCGSCAFLCAPAALVLLVSAGLHGRSPAARGARVRREGGGV